MLPLAALGRVERVALLIRLPRGSPAGECRRAHFDGEGMMPTVALAYSGGLNCSVLLWEQLAEGRDVVCVHVDWGQASCDQELRAARAIVGLANSHGQRARLVSVKVSSLAGPGCFNDYALPVMAIANSHARTARADRVACGVDCDTLSICGLHGSSRALANILHGFSAGKLGYYPPYRHRSKQWIVRRGRRLRMPLRLTWSCLAAPLDPELPAHCGVCRGCRARRQAFHAAGVTDRTPYEGGPHEPEE